MPLNIPKKNIPRIVVVGAGFAGLTLVRKLSKLDVQLVLLDKDNFHTFQPLLYQLATAELSVDSVTYPLREAFQGEKNVHFRLTEIMEVEPEKRLLHTREGKVEYDYLVFATGTNVNFFGMEHIRKNSFALKTVQDAVDIRSRIFNRLEHFLTLPENTQTEEKFCVTIVGGGPTGVELAGALGEIKQHLVPEEYPKLVQSKFEVQLLEGNPRILSGMKKESSVQAQKYLEDLGVTVVTECLVKDYQDNKIIAKDNEFQSDMLIWSAGVVGRPVEGLDADDIVKGQRIDVDQISRVKGYDDIFAIGDVACMRSETYPNGHPMLAQAAVQQAKHLAGNFKRILQDETPESFEYKHKGFMATVGTGKAVMEMPQLKLYGRFAYYIWLGVHLKELFGARNMMLTLFNWLWSNISNKRSTRFIFSLNQNN